MSFMNCYWQERAVIVCQRGCKKINPANNLTLALRTKLMHLKNHLVYKVDSLWKRSAWVYKHAQLYAVDLSAVCCDVWMDAATDWAIERCYRGYRVPSCGRHTDGSARAARVVITLRPSAKRKWHCSLSARLARGATRLLTLYLQGGPY